MPTFRNDTARPIIYNVPGVDKIIIFDPKKIVPLKFWVPYLQLGLSLEDANYPPVPNTVEVSGRFNFSSGMERRFNIDPCDAYSIKIKVTSGGVALYLGSAANCININDEYQSMVEWKNAPYLRIGGAEDDTVVEILAMIER